MSIIERTLIYPGAGWDSAFYRYFSPKGYTKFILYDTMPKFKHYEPQHHGWTNQERFFDVLKEKFGDYINNEEDSCLTFPDRNITYYYSTNAELIIPPTGDILLRGYVPKNWFKYFDNRIVFLSEDTYFGDYADEDNNETFLSVFLEEDDDD